MYRYILLGAIGILLIAVWWTSGTQKSGRSEGTQLLNRDTNEVVELLSESTSLDEVVVSPASTDRSLRRSESIVLPVPHSAPTKDVLHTVAIEDIRQGCFGQDCIPSVDFPKFVTPSALTAVLDPTSIGIALTYKGEERFYPFPMLETHELVNDVVADDPLLISYCPLCGTGIVFSRRLDDEVVEFGVSGMLWNSNLLMYNRAENIDDRNLWSQVLGEAVVGARAGEKLEIVASDIMQFGSWAIAHPNGSVLTTGVPQDPYGGNYYQVARNFAPDFNERKSPLAPDTYVYGVIVGETPVAYPETSLSTGVTTHVVHGEIIEIEKTDTGVVIISQNDVILPDIEGFWFSWVAAHPDTQIWQVDN